MGGVRRGDAGGASTGTAATTAERVVPRNMIRSGRRRLHGEEGGKERSSALRRGLGSTSTITVVAARHDGLNILVLFCIF